MNCQVSHTINRAYKYRAYVTHESLHQRLAQEFGNRRFVWNELVRNFNNYGTDEYIDNLCEKTLKDDPEFNFLQDSIAYCLQQVRIDFTNTKSQYFNKRRKVQLGRMRFKARGRSKDSFRIPGSVMLNAIKRSQETGLLRLPKYEHDLRLVIDRPFNGKVNSVTVSKDRTGAYYVSFQVEEEVQHLPKTGKLIGLDLGISDFIVTSTGHKVENPRWFCESQAKLAKAQRDLSRKQKNSVRYEKQRRKVAQIHSDIANRRNHFHHELSARLVKQFDVIVVEDLAVKNMVKNSKLSKHISDCGWREFVDKLIYKAKWYGKDVHKVDRFFASTKTCNVCGYHYKDITLDVREWTCPDCNSHHQRDHNAANNILRKGLEDLFNLTSAELVDYRRGEDVRGFEELVLQTQTSVKRLFVPLYES